MKTTLKATQLTRRVLLRGAAGGALALPLMQSCTPSRSATETSAQSRQALAFPTRIIFFYTPNGKRLVFKFKIE